jgi:proteasome activator subunit 4
LFNGEHLHLILPVVEPLMTGTDKFKQAAAAEMLTGLLSGILPVLYRCIHI